MTAGNPKAVYACVNFGEAYAPGEIAERSVCIDERNLKEPDNRKKQLLLGKGAVLIEEAKWCGKTTTAEQIAGSILYMADPEKEQQNLTMAEISPGRLLKGKIPRLIDEWQIAPKLWDAVRFEVDHRDEMGQFSLTGSAVLASYE